MSSTGPTIWLNGALLDDATRAAVSATDHGLVVGDGVFEALKVTPAGPFALRRHLERLSRSAAAMRLSAPDHDAVRVAVDAVLTGRTFGIGKVRITYTAGPGPLGSQAAYGPATLVVAAAAMQPPPTVTDVVTAPWRRNEHGALTGVKSTSYAEAVLGLAYAHDHDCGEAIFRNTGGNLCEGTGSNVFAVFGDRIITPPLSAGPLAGITRELLLEWADVTEADLTLDDILRADEVFLTSSLRDLQRVRHWDDHAYAKAHPVTDHLTGLFARRSSQDLEP